MSSLVLSACLYGPIVGLAALGAFGTYRGLGFPDLTVDGSFALGGCVCATLLMTGVDPVLSTALGAAAGLGAGLVTGVLYSYLGLGVLSGIITSFALYSINLRILGRPNIGLRGSRTIFDLFSDGASSWLNAGLLALAAGLALMLFTGLLRTFGGLSILASGANKDLVERCGVSSRAFVAAGVSVFNVPAALGGALMVQQIGFVDVNMGLGMIISAFGALLIGELLFTRVSDIRRALPAAVGGGYVHQLIVAGVLRLGLPTGDQRLYTAIMLVMLLWFRGYLRQGSSRSGGRM